MRHRHRFHLLSPVLPVGILLLAAYLRLHHLSATPGWFSDEATHVEIARHLLDGEWRYLAVGQSTLLFARLPLFEIVLAGMFRVFGVGMGSLRLLTAGCGVASVALLYIVLREITGNQHRLPLLAAGVLAIYPQAVLYSRFGFSYNLLVPLVLLVLYGTWRYLTAATADAWRGLLLASLGIGVGLLSEVMLVSLVPVLALTMIGKGVRQRSWRMVGRDGLRAAGALLLPVLLYAGVMLLLVPEVFRFDLAYTLFRLGGQSLTTQVQTLSQNYTTLLSSDPWLLAGIIGLWLVRPLTLRWLVLALWFIPVVMMGRTVALFQLSAYYLIPLLPVIAIGVAALLDRAVPTITRTVTALLPAELPAVGRSLIAGLVALLVIGTPLLITLDQTLTRVNTHWQTAIDPFLLDPVEAQAAAACLNALVQTGEVVVASPVIGALLDATIQVADFQMSIAATGVMTPHLPGNLPPERWLFDARPVEVDYVVLDPLWRGWGAAHIPGLDGWMQAVEAAWTPIYRRSTITVYRALHPGQPLSNGETYGNRCG